jgi:hypothetical protein
MISVARLVLVCALLAGCDANPREVYVRMTTAAQLGDREGFLEGFNKSSRKLIEAAISLSEAYAIEDANPVQLFVFDEIEEEQIVGKGEEVGKKFVCKAEKCAILKVRSGERKKRQLLMVLEPEQGWAIDTVALEEFWKTEGAKY